MIRSANELLKIFNSKIPQLSNMRTNNREEYENLLRELKEIRNTINTEELWKAVKEEYNMVEEEKKNKIFTVKKEGRPIAILSEDILKIGRKTVLFENRLSYRELDCTPVFNYEKLIEINKVNLKEYLCMLKIAPYVILHGLIHSYRSYEPYISILLVGLENKLYTFDMEAHANLFEQNVDLLNSKMIFTDSKTASYFPNLDKYCQFELKNRMYIDYRIRPISLIENYILEILQSATVNSVHQNILEEKNVLSQNSLLEKLHHLREFAGRQFDESPEFVITDEQIKELISTGDLQMKSYAFVAFKDDFYRLVAPQKKLEIPIKKVKPSSDQ